MTTRVASLTLVLCLAVLAAGCGDKQKNAQTAEAKEKKIADARAKLSEADRALVDAQEYCPVMTEQRLGSMGVPLKVMIKDQPVFLCCKGCEDEATAKPDETLEAVKAAKAKKKKP